MRRLHLLLILLVPFILTACEVDEVLGPVASCDPVPAAIEPDSGPTAGGTEATVTGLFVAGDTVDDVQVRVGSADADVLSVAREGCGACDACAAEVLRCASCDRECRGLAEYADAAGVIHAASECVEAVVFVTPPGPAGPAAVSIINARGQTAALTFTYADGDDDDSAGDDDDDSAGDDDDDSAGDDDDDSAGGDDDDSAGDDDDSAGDDDDSGR